MIINLEKLANKLTMTLFNDADIDEVEKAKIEYGFSITLGLIIALLLAIIVAAFLGTVPNTILIILSAQGLRFFTGGAHCSSFDRCTSFTLLVFIPASLLVKHFTVTLGPETVTNLYLVLLLIIVFFYVFSKWRVAAAVLAVNGTIVVLCYMITGEFLPGVMISIATGLFIQSIMATKPGGWFVEGVDYVLKIIGI